MFIIFNTQKEKSHNERHTDNLSFHMLGYIAIKPKHKHLFKKIIIKAIIKMFHMQYLKDYNF
jgi:hypothetical protein